MLFNRFLLLIIFTRYRENLVIIILLHSLTFIIMINININLIRITVWYRSTIFVQLKMWIIKCTTTWNWTQIYINILRIYYIHNNNALGDWVMKIVPICVIVYYHFHSSDYIVLFFLCYSLHSHTQKLI